MFFQMPQLHKQFYLVSNCSATPKTLYQMKRAGLLVILTYFLSSGCSDSYHQDYDNFNEFNKVNQRNKGWFPDIISNDAYDLKNTSYLDSLTAFGTFSYSNSKYYDSIFANSNAKKIDFSTFEQKVNRHISRKPEWFLNLENASNNDYQVIQIERFFIARRVPDKRIYFVLSN
jgi:hypothetical protein